MRNDKIKTLGTDKYKNEGERKSCTHFHLFLQMKYNKTLTVTT